MSKHTLLTLVLMCGFSSVAQTATEPAVPLPRVDVPAPQVDPSPASVTRTSPSGVVTLIDTTAHRGEAKDLAELLAPTPGVVLSDSGGFGQRKSLSMRGAGSTGVLVLLDGIPLAAPGSSVDLSEIPSAIVERIEVLRGASSARYGPGGLGGVVNLVTRRPTHGASLTGEVSWGSFGTALASASASSPVLGGEGLLLAHGARSNGDFGFLSDQQPALPTNALTPMVRANNQASAGGALLRYRRDLSARLSLDILGEGGALTRGLAGPAHNPTSASSETAGHGLLGARLTRQFDGGGELSALGWGRLDDNTLVGAVLGESLPWHQTQGAAGLEVAFSQLVFTRHGISAAANLTSEWLQAPRDTHPSSVRGGLMLGDEVFFFDGALAINATVRVDQSGPFTGFSPRIGGLVLLPFGLELRANAGQAHRPPTFFELYVQQGQLAPNPALRPERALSADAAIGLRRERGFAQVGGFGAAYEDLIAYEFYPPMRAGPVNFAGARAMGFEAEGTVEPVAWFSVAGSYTFLKTQNLKDKPAFYLKTLPYRPEHSLSARASVGPRRVRAHAEVLYQSQQFTNRTETVALAERAFVNVGLVTQPFTAPSVTLAFELKNLLDVQSQDFDGYPLPSRGAYLTLSIGWEPTPAVLAASRSPIPKESHP